MIMWEKLPEEIREKIYTYAHPSLTKKQKEYIKLQMQIQERKSFMVKYCWVLFESFVRGSTLRNEMTPDEVEATIHILSKCTCCKNSFSKKTNRIVFKCGCMHYMRTLFELRGEDHCNIYKYKSQPLKTSYENIRTWEEFEKCII